MKSQRMRMAGDGDRLSGLPEPILLHILSFLRSHKEVVKTSVLSSQWQFRWKAVPMVIDFRFPQYPVVDKVKIHAFMSSTMVDLCRLRSSEKIKALNFFPYRYADYLDTELNFWVEYATTLVKVEEFTLKFDKLKYPGFEYEFPAFAYRNGYFKNLVLGNCRFNDSASFNWTNLAFLSIGNVGLTNNIMAKVLLGCPNLKCLELDKVCGMSRLKISSVKLIKLIMTNHNIRDPDLDEHIHELEIFAPYIEHLELLGFCRHESRLMLTNVTSLQTAILSLNVDFFDLENNNEKLDKEGEYWRGLLESVAHVQNLELGPWCIQVLSMLESKGWLFPPSRWKFFKLNASLKQLDYLGISTFLLSSPDLETLVFHWNNHRPRGLLSRYSKEDEQSKRFESQNINCSLLHLKTIKFINFYGKLSENKFLLPLVKSLLKNAAVLEKFVLAGKFKGSDVSRDYAKMEQELLSLPRSSPRLKLSLLETDF